MPRIFYVIDSFAIGGAQTQLLQLIRKLDKSRYHAAVCPVWPLSGLEKAYQATGAEIIHVYKHHSLDITEAFRLARAIKVFKADIVHTWLFTGSLWGRLAALLARTPVVIASERSIRPQGYDSFGVMLLNKYLAGMTDVITVNSRAGYRTLLKKKYSASQIHIINNGVDTLKFSPKVAQKNRSMTRKNLDISENTVLIGMVGRMAYPKDQTTLLRALQCIIKLGHNVHLVLVGDGPDLNQIQNTAATMGLTARIHFTGQRDDIPEILSGLDIFCLSSKWEGMPNAVLEAMAMGLPVVATDVAGTAEAVVEGVTGYLVPAGDYSTMAERLISLIEDPSLRKKMGVSGQLRCEQDFSLEKMVIETTKLYEDLLSTMH